MERKTILATACAAILLATATWVEAAETTIQTLPDQGWVSVFGTVEQIHEQGFILRDGSGRVKVKLPSIDSTIVDEGDLVTVDGAVDKSGINASRVDIHRRAAL